MQQWRGRRHRPREHLERVAEILSNRFKGVLFIWDTCDSSRRHQLYAVWENRRKFAAGLEEKITAAGDVIAKNVAAKHPLKTGLLAWLLRRRMKRG